MSQEINDQQPRELEAERSKTQDLEMKLMEVGTQKYHIDMRQNGDSRFFSIIEGPHNSRLTRIMVPMSVAENFCEKLYEISKFVSTYTPKNVSETKNPRDRVQFAHTVSLLTPGGRRYYFDLKDAEDSLVLRMSYLFNSRRYCISIAVEALPNLLEILEGFKTQYPSISLTDDYPANSSRRRFPGPPQQGRQPRVPYTSRFYNKPFRSDPRPSSQFNGKPGEAAEGTEGRRTSGLRVLTDPMPVQIVNNSKRISCEIVEGTRTFLRVTEFINDMKKSTLHIPIEVCAELQSIIGDMQRKYSQSQKSVGEPNS